MACEVRWVFASALFFIATSFNASASLDLSKIHEHMTNDELFSAFHVKDRGSVPDYEVVPVFHEQNSHRSRRSIPLGHSNGRYFVTVKNLELYLEPVDHVLLGQNTPVYLASGDKSQPLGIRYKRVQKAWPSNFNMYQDPANNAVFSMFKEPDGQVNFEGTIGNDVVIKPLPSRLKNATLRSHHFLYKKKFEKAPMSPDSYSDDSRSSKFFDYVLPQKLQSLRAESKVDVVYPEILVIVDHETYLAHGKNVQALAKYMALFWNAVDLRFRAMTQPQVRLNIAGLIVPTDKYGAPYMTYHREGMHYLRTSETFDEIGNYLHRDERFGWKMYDLVVAITNFDLCSTVLGGCSPSTLGMARIGGACNHDEGDADVAVAVVEDHGSFDGVLTAAHEIAHLLGSVHDGEDSYFGLGAEDCNGSDGFLMASLIQGSSNAFLWSDCSIRQMQYFLRRGAECLRNKPVVKKPYPKGLPGQLMSRDEQCRITHGTFECKNFARDECGELYCRKSGDMFSYYCVSSRPPAEGSPCGDGGMCLDGKCVRVESNEVTARATAAVPEGRELIHGADD